jgi:hypothetical protein
MASQLSSVNFERLNFPPSSRSSTSNPGKLPSDEIHGINRRATASRNLLYWPAVNTILHKTLVSADESLAAIDRGGIEWLTSLEFTVPPLKLAPDDALTADLFVGTENIPPVFNRIIFSNVGFNVIAEYSQYYFDTFNCFYPLLDSDDYFSEVITRVANGFGYEDPESIFVLLVIALGKCAYEGTFGPPLQRVDGVLSGIRGGSSASPPGLNFFDEARKRMGAAMTECNLKNVQIFCLTACVLCLVPNPF